MMISDDSKHPRSRLIRALGLSVALLALAGLILAGGQLVRAGLPVEMARAGLSAEVAQVGAPWPVVTAADTYTVCVPLVFYCLPLDGVTVDGPSSGTMFFEQTFTAAASSAGARMPVTYTWRATGQAPIVDTGGLDSQASFTWDLAGTKIITVEAVNICGGVVIGTFTHTVTSRGLVAFERSIGGEPHDIWLVDSNRSGLEVNLTNTPDLDEGAPTWSPDGNWIAFAAGQGDGNRAIYKMDLRSRQVTALTDGTYNDRWPTWSPTTDQIAFMRVFEHFPDVFIMNTDGTAQERLANYEYGGSEFPSFSPDGQWIAFISARNWAGRDIYIVEPDDPGSVQIVMQTDRPTDDDRRDEIYPSWSPSGWIYYTYKYKDHPGDLTEYLYRVKPDGSGMTKVFNDSYNRWIASWAPDGECVAFYSYLGENNKEVWRWCANTGQTVKLTDTAENVSNEFCAWSPVP